jgi:hypothetical protein
MFLSFKLSKNVLRDVRGAVFLNHTAENQLKLLKNSFRSQRIKIK